MGEPLALPVLVYISRRALPGREDDLLQWADALCSDASRFTGYLGSSVRTAPDPDGATFIVGVRFRSAMNLLAWEKSEQRHRRLEEGSPLTAGRPVAISLQELEAGLAGEPGRIVPKWRTALMVWLALFPLALLSGAVLLPWLAALPWPLPTAISTLATVAAVIWITLPLVHRAFRIRIRRH
ncbi:MULTISPECIES: hypothetical protein [unclassified Microbacterium]|uniref:hypothetical protein n=1 Tax=unclassified Microbacterium TaxID=2609290 RepID=UPI00095C3A26|nr:MULTISPECIES: hypothetical protein [unclassified Microbacterium]OJV93326.1 MAG: hypothetical protein BGO47_05055 [Microbacterium sp. 67-17]|tara:strand:+ start:46392 stop:46937 length:546 start_codon:yes stop_codon:yes gene_type:complete